MSYVNVQDRKLPFFLRYLADLMTYRHLCWNLVASDLRSRFRRTTLGILWAVIQPLGFALMVALVWGSLGTTGNYWEYALYVLSGMVAFDMFTTAFSNGQAILQNSAGFVKQARIPLFIFQLRLILTGTVMFFFGVLTVTLFSTAIGLPPTLGPQLALVPAFFGVIILFALPIAMIMSVIGVLYRDVQHISQLVERAVFFISPVMLPREVMALPHLRFLEVVNPMVPLLDLFRDPLLYGKMWDPQDMMVMAIWIVALWTLALITVSSVGRKIVFSI